MLLRPLILHVHVYIILKDLNLLVGCKYIIYKMTTIIIIFYIQPLGKLNIYSMTHTCIQNEDVMMKHFCVSD